MSSCTRSDCPGAHGEGGTKADPDHLILHSHGRRRHRWHESFAVGQIVEALVPFVKELFKERRSCGQLCGSEVTAHYDRAQKVLVVDCDAYCHDEDWSKQQARNAYWAGVQEERHLLSCSREEGIRHCVRLADAWHAKVREAATAYASAPRDHELREEAS